MNKTFILFAVGLGFAIAFKMSDNNLIISYFVNLPNAFITYIIKSKKFPVFDNDTIIYVIVTIGLIVALLVISKNIMNMFTTEKI